MPPGRGSLEVFDLLDWKRRIFAAYADVRADREPHRAWERWRGVRDEMFRSHPQTPIPPERRAGSSGLPFYGYDPAARVLADLSPAEGESLEIAGSAGETFRFVRAATATFELGGERRSLALFWVEGYGGGLFLSFRDGTSGLETYGAGRYLLDTVKGADLGMEDGRLVLDFNFAYNPSCAYDPRWACPLAPPENRLGLEIRAGERYP